MAWHEAVSHLPPGPRDSKELFAWPTALATLFLDSPEWFDRFGPHMRPQGGLGSNGVVFNM